MLGQFPLSQFGPDMDSAPQGSSRGRKRALLVCFRCHEKKIKCDLAKKAQEEGSDRIGRGMRCSNCAEAACPCQLRPSRRGKRRAPPVDAPPLDESFNTTFDMVPGNSLLLQTSFPVGNKEGVPGECTESLSECAVASDDHVSEGNVRRPGLRKTGTFSSYPGDCGFMSILGGEPQGASQQHQQQQHQQHQQQQPETGAVWQLDYGPEGLIDGHLEVFFEYAYTWCPILDKDTLESVPNIRQSLLLRHALAVCANQIRPSLLHYSTPSEHYDRVKELFYGNQEPNPLIRVISLMLLYWWSAEPPNVVNIDNTAWWTGLAIQLVQQIGLHRDARAGDPRFLPESSGLRRRIWWTLVARERITSISQGRPCLIDLNDSDVPMPVPSDFPQPKDPKVTVYLRWISLCQLVGNIGKMMRRRRLKGHEDPTKMIGLARDLINWVQDLPISVQPAFKDARTRSFCRDVHGLHLTYLSTITLLHLDQDAQPLPTASVAAVVAASCTARIFREYLIRGSISFLAGQSGWYIAMAILALLQARCIDGLAAHADADIEVLRAALGVMAKTWSSAKMFEAGIERLMAAATLTQQSSRGEARASARGLMTTATGGDPTMLSPPPSIDELSTTAGIQWQHYFPYVNEETSPLIAALLARGLPGTSLPEVGWMFDVSGQLNQFLQGEDDVNLDFLNMWPV